MDDELVKRLRERAAWINFPHHGEEYPTKDAKLMMGAADAIEEMSRENESLAKSVNEASEILRKRWIPVTERLPDHEYGESTSVLTVDLFGEMRVLYFNGGNWCWPSGEALTTVRVAPITHWMPRPVPPEEEH